ncbi:hypothetical protein C8R43DRAFT_963406 [Mycena crocata]|nr:hypothetical protein C8R43DRAFT_963406 [Mycena crocata]
MHFTCPELSPELIDRVIDHLSDLSSVKTCGLVCRQWFPRSRFHLFSKVKLQVGKGQLRAQTLPDTVDTFLDLVDTSFFDILSAVRYLSLSYGDRSSLEKAHLVRFSECSHIRDLVIALPPNSGHTEEMLHSLHTQLGIVGPKFSSLSTFSFFFHHSPLPALLTVLSHLPTLEVLWFGGGDISEGTVPPCLFPPRLHALDMHVLRGGEAFFGHLLQLPALPQLRSITLDNDEMELHDGTPIAMYLNRAGTALEFMELTLWARSAFEQRALRYSSNLRHLSIFSHAWDHPSTYILDLLSAASSSKFETIKIEATHMPDFSAAALDQSLAIPQFRNLRSFALRTGTATFSRPALQAAMPLATARGILQ